MASLISHLPKKAQKQLLDDINYLKMEELQSFCNKHSIPYKISYESSNGEVKLTKEKDRKGVVIKRIQHYLTTTKILPATCFSKSVVKTSSSKPDSPTKTSRLYYGHYDKKYVQMFSLLRELTEGEFKDGAIARILIREFWSKECAPTYQEYAKSWLKAKAEHISPNPEWAFLSDLVSGKAGDDWKDIRNKKANKVMKILNKIQLIDSAKL